MPRRICLDGVYSRATLIPFKLCSRSMVLRSPEAWTIISVFDLVPLKILPKSGYFPVPVISLILI